MASEPDRYSSKVHRESNRGKQEERGGRTGDGEKKGERPRRKEMTERGGERRRRVSTMARGLPPHGLTSFHHSTQVHPTGREKKCRGALREFETGPGQQISTASLCLAFLITKEPPHLRESP